MPALLYASAIEKYAAPVKHHHNANEQVVLRCAHLSCKLEALASVGLASFPMQAKHLLLKKLNHSLRCRIWRDRLKCVCQLDLPARKRKVGEKLIAARRLVVLVHSGPLVCLPKRFNAFVSQLGHHGVQVSALEPQVVLGDKNKARRGKAIDQPVVVSVDEKTLRPIIGNGLRVKRHKLRVVVRSKAPCPAPK